MALFKYLAVISIFFYTSASLAMDEEKLTGVVPTKPSHKPADLFVVFSYDTHRWASWGPTMFPIPPKSWRFALNDPNLTLRGDDKGQYIVTKDTYLPKKDGEMDYLDAVHVLFNINTLIHKLTNPDGAIISYIEGRKLTPKDIPVTKLEELRIKGFLYNYFEEYCKINGMSELKTNPFEGKKELLDL